MSDRNKKENTGELIDLKKLIGDADGGDFTLDDIMAEYGHPPHPPKDEEEREAEEMSNTIVLSELSKLRPSAPKKGEQPGKVVAFPGPPPAKEEKQTAPPKTGGPAGGQPAPVIPFPKEESVLSSLIKDLGKKADDYADRMFEEDESVDKKEIRRLEKLIPGTDQEEVADHSGPASPKWRRPPRPPEQLPPDTPPQDLARRCGRGLKWLRTRSLLVFLLGLVSLAQVVFPATGLAWPEPLDQPEIQQWAAVGLLGAGTLLSADVLLTGIARACFLKFGMDTLSALACGLTLADGIVLALSEKGPDRLPYTLVCLAGQFFLLHGAYHKRCAMRLSCRAAASASAPYRVTLEPELWSEQDTYTKQSGEPDGFGSQLKADDGAQRIFRRICPLLFLADIAFGLLASVGGEHPERLLWALSALFAATASFGGSLVYGRSFHKTARRLNATGAALAGWPGIAASRKGTCILITDGDLFPPGYVELNGFKVMGDFPAERVVAYTATLIRDSGSGLTKLFHDQLRSMGGLLRNAEGLICHEAGGLSANIRGDQVLVGSAAFMKLMEVKLPQGLNVKNAVFCAIDGQLAGIFALSYALPDAVFPMMETLLLEKVEPVLATRDFNLIPAMLRQRFKLAAEKMAFPPVARRWELSDPEREHEGALTALLCREGLAPFAESVTAARRLRWATRLGAILCCAGSALGMLLSAYLTALGAYSALSPLHLFIYLLTWTAPVWFLSGWVHRF